MSELTYVEKSRSHSNVVSLFGVVVCSIPAAFDIPREASAIALTAVILWPLAVTWLDTRRLVTIDPVSVIGIAWILAVTLPVFTPHLYKDRSWYTLSTWSLDSAALWMYRGWAMCCISYWSVRVWHKKRRNKISLDADVVAEVRYRRCVGVLSAFGGVAYVWYMGGKTFQYMEAAWVPDSTAKQIILLFSDLCYLYVFLYFYDKQRVRFHAIDSYIFMSVIAVRLVIFVGSGSKYSILSLCAASFLGAIGTRVIELSLRNIFIIIVSLIAGYGILDITSEFVQTYREEMAINQLPIRENTLDVLTLQLETCSRAVSRMISGEKPALYSRFTPLDRFAHLSHLATFLEFTSGVSRYENSFSSFFVPIISVVPRAIFDKVHFFDSGDFARMYGWTYGGISITIIGSFFWTWGYIGILGGMAGFGIMFGWLYERSQEVDGFALVCRSIMIILVVRFLDLGTTFQGIVGVATRYAVFLALLCYLVRKGTFRKGGGC